MHIARIVIERMAVSEANGKEGGRVVRARLVTKTHPKYLNPSIRRNPSTALITSKPMRKKRVTCGKKKQEKINCE